jgi:hypothetical protein|uniref:Uncharacterized protein n=1 Tax=candidate division WOR-3 bacterium TaxID=2052148 RepID=A0A7C3Z0U7_UNCW3
MTTEELIERVAKRIVELRLTPIAIVLLESAKPLSFVGSQVLVFFQPIVTSIFPLNSYEEFVRILEDRNNVERLIQMIENEENQREKIRLEKKNEQR